MAFDSLRPQLVRVAATLALELSELQATALLDYLALLRHWNSTYNLTSVRNPEGMLVQHVADCLAIIKPLRAQCQEEIFRLLDVGSGGGLPGVVIAIMNPAALVTCVDSVGKKAAFVQQVALELRLANLSAKHARVEQLPAGSFNVIASRAFATLADFARLTQRQIADHGVWMAMKGKRFEEELSGLPPTVDVFHVEQIDVPGLDAERCLVWMRPKS
jgi:16S rRNA (guanine527-N7)-methyltransferase